VTFASAVPDILLRMLKLKMGHVTRPLFRAVCHQ